jgi:nucleoside phosphorylase
MFFSESARLAEATADLGDLAERLDSLLEGANESWVLHPDEVASTLRASPDLTRHLLDVGARSEIGLLRVERYLQCTVCQNLMPVEDVRTALDDGDAIDCTQCGETMTGKEPEATVYRLSDEAVKQARARAARPERMVVILTALPVELRAVHSHLSGLQRNVHEAGTVYSVGRFEAERVIWKVATVAVRAGNAGAAAEAERAIAYFQPEVALFIGIAGGIKDVALGDVVAANEVYLYHAGKALEEFEPRPEVFRSAYGLVQQASAEALEGRWLVRIRDGRGVPKAIVEPIAAGEQVVASEQADTYRFIRDHYSRAVAVEMEGAGFLRAAYGNQKVEALVIRGISDLIGNKEIADLEGWQPVASAHAAAFAFELLANLS